jgi:hypothetical protein
MATDQNIVGLILNDIEKDAVGSFVSNKTLFDAVKKVILAAVYFNGTLRQGQPARPTLNAALSLAMSKEYSNEQLGEDLRALAEGVRLVEVGFGKLEELKPADPKPEKPKNPAR